MTTRETETNEAVELNRFSAVMLLLQQSYDKKHGRTLDPDQVASLLEGFHKIAMDAFNGEQVIMQLMAKIEELEAEIEGMTRRGKLWKPRG